MRFVLLLLALLGTSACARTPLPAPRAADVPIQGGCLRRATPAIGAARLEELRTQIDCVDRALAHLAGERLEIARRIGAVKRMMGAPVVDTVREAAVVARFARLARTEGLDSATATTLIRALILAARAEQQGPPGQAPRP